MIFYSTSKNPFINLALENQILSRINNEEKILFLYENEASVVMGRFQNPWLECDINKINNDKIHFVRRQSGGGTVYHDTNNVNFCFITGSRDHQKDINNNILVRALEKIGISAYASGRSDLMVDYQGPKKISGSAFKQKKDRSFHHGTMLIGSDLTALNNYLKSDHSDIEAKGIKSVRSNVINLSDINTSINLDMYKASVIESFNEYMQANFKVQIISENDLVENEYFASLQAWEWLYGETPKFVIERHILGMDVFLEANKGLITKIQINSGSLSSHISYEFQNLMMGRPLKKTALDAVHTTMMNEYPDFAEDINALKSIVLKLELFL